MNLNPIAHYRTYLLYKESLGKVLAVAPIGTGVEPSSAIFYIYHLEDESVEWQLDARGWAVGWKVVKSGS